MTALVRVQDAESFLASLDQAKAFLAACTSFDDAKQVRDKAKALLAWTRAHGEAQDLGRHAGILELRALRRMGELAPEKLEPEERSPGRPSKQFSRETISQTPAEKRTLHIARAVAALPAEKFEAELARAEKPGAKPPAVKPLLRDERVARETAKARAIAKATGMCAVEDLERLADEVQAGKRPPFGCIYADPPWAYDNQGTRGCTNDEYPTMSLEDIAALPVRRLVADEAHLHIWTTSTFLFDTKPILEAWGFEYKSYFAWVKPQLGLGNYWRQSHETMLLGTRGGLVFRDHSIPSWIQADRGRHSAKPDAVRQLIERASPGPCLELFGRVTTPGWVVWGNEVERTLFNAAAFEVTT